MMHTVDPPQAEEDHRHCQNVEEELILIHRQNHRSCSEQHIHQ